MNRFWFCDTLSLFLCAQACWALGYVVATLFFAVVEMSIDTIILSFCQDSEENEGNAQHAPSLLLETLDSNHEEEEVTDR